MFDAATTDAARPTADLQAALAQVVGVPEEGSSAALLARIEALESIKNACAGAQARLTRAFEAAQREEQALAGVPESERGLGVAQQVGLARRESPFRARAHAGLAAVLPEMPHLQAALDAGRIGEYRATLVARATALLTLEDRQEVDRRLAPRLDELSDRGVEAAACALAYELDPTCAVRGRRRAEADRRVSLRPAPDGMTHVTAFLPLVQGVAIEKALREAVVAARGDGGDERTDGQIRADTLFARVTGLADAGEVSFEVGLVMTDSTLIAGAPEPGRVEGYGPVPAAFLRDLLRGDAGASADIRPARVWLRRLFTDPVDGSLTSMDRRRRLFTGAVRDLVVARDQECRTPWCDAPIRHVDHALAWARGGGTGAENGQGLCVACNQAKEAPGWRAEPVDLPGRGHAVRTTTPTGASYVTAAPPLLPQHRTDNPAWWRRTLAPPDHEDPYDETG